MVTIFDNYAEYFLIIITVGFLFAPVVHYLIRGWGARRHEILSSFGKGTILRYFKVFFSAEVEAIKDPKLDFTKLYDKRFGRQHFIIPGVCLFAISGFLLVLVSWTIFFWLREESRHQLVLPPIAVAAVAGAYMWVMHDFIRRTQQHDLGPTNLFWASFRLLVAAPLGLAVATLLKNEVGVAVAVLLGAFPTRTLFTIARRVVRAKLNLGNFQEERRYELEALQGIRRVQAERFADEGIESILQLAYSDPIDLTMRTNFSFSYVVDCCSQALAWLYFGQDLAKMWRFSLRGGQEICSLIAEIDKLCPSETRSLEEIKEQAEKCLQELSKQINMDREVLERTMREIAEDPYTLFLYDVWCFEDETQTKD